MALFLPAPEVVTQVLQSALHHVRARIVGNVLAAVALATFLGAHDGGRRLMPWLAGVGVGILAQLVLARAWARGTVARGRMVRLLTLVALGMGAVWGLVGAVAAPAPGDLVCRTAILLFFATVSGASALTNGALPALFVAEAIPMWSVGLVGVFAAEPASVLALAAPVLLFIGVLAHHNRRLHRQIREMVELRVQNELLVRELQAEQELARDVWSQVSRQQEALMSAFDEVNDQACRDTLTGLFNRRRFFEVLDAASRGLDEGRVGFCVAVLDVDHFKRVNDGYGHAMGDRVLQAIAAEISAAVRVHDVVARIGGEEIAVLFQRTTLQDAHTAAERVRARVEAISFADVPTLHLSVSIGVAEATPGVPGGALVARADVAMYRAKEGGRNRVVVEAPMS